REVVRAIKGCGGCRWPPAFAISRCEMRDRILSRTHRMERIQRYLSATRESFNLEHGTAGFRKQILIKLDYIGRAWKFWIVYFDLGGSRLGVRLVRLLRSCLAAIVLFAGLSSGAEAANRAPVAVSDEATPPQIQQLVTLLADPKVQQ